MSVCFVICDVWKWLRRKWIKAYKDHPENSKRYLFAKAESPSPLLFSNYDLDFIILAKEKRTFFITFAGSQLLSQKGFVDLTNICTTMCIARTLWCYPGQKEIHNQIKILELQSAPRFSIRFEDRIQAT